MSTKIVSYQNKPITYRIIGAGYPVVLLHGFAEDGDVWHHQIDFLKDKYQLIVPDIPGSGSSHFNEQLSTIDEYADAIKIILDNEKISECIFIGHSLGGYIALAFADKYPHLLKAFGLFHSTAFADSEEKKQTRLKAIDFIKANGAHTFIKTSAPGLFTENFKIKNAKEIDELIALGEKFKPEALIQYYHAMIARPDRTRVLRNFSKPVLFIMGEQDNVVPIQTALQQCHLSSISHICVLTNSAHMGMWEDVAKSNEALSAFLKIICESQQSLTIH